MKDIFRAVAVVDIEIDDGYTLQPVVFERMSGADGNVVEQAETHGPIAFSVVAGRADGAECIFGLA